MTEPTRPLLPLPAGRPATARGRPVGGKATIRPKKDRLAARIDPRFTQLENVVTSKLAALTASPANVAPELVVVFETITTASTFVAALKATPELKWLADADLEDVAPDDDFHRKGDAAKAKALSARLFLILANHQAITELLSLWRQWIASSRAKLPDGHKHWGPAFSCLRDVRVWGTKDRIRETGLDEDWRERKALGQQVAPVEIELWYRGQEQRAAAAARVRRHVAAAGGAVHAESTIEAIAYHAVLAELPAAAIEGLLNDAAVELLRSDDVHLLRPVPQLPRPGRGPVPDGDPLPLQAVPRPTTTPLVALLDGLPLQNHALLRGRLIVDDPDGWETSCPAETRLHGTAMASLLLHGDRGTEAAATARPLYVRPILRPRMDLDRNPEEAPQRELLVDVVHRAVVRIVGSGAVSAAAPTVRVINLSIGDAYRPFLGEMSPLARLIDWLSWRHHLLFIVSAGNHSTALTISDGDAPLEERTLRTVQENHRLRRLLSPAESINAITVGAAHVDDAGPWQARNPDERELLTTTEMPSPISALGRGHRRSVKPDLLAPGGRVVFNRDIADRRVHAPSHNRTRFPPGQRVASPFRQAGVDGEVFTSGTSNAAALTSRAAGRLLEAIAGLKATPEGAAIAGIPDAILAKALLVHTASWSPDAHAVLDRALRNDQNAARMRDHLCAFIGYGLLREERAIECLHNRATLVGGGVVPLGGAVEHRVPLPASMNAYTGVRSWIVTLAWFSPVRATDRRYRIAALDFVQKGAQEHLVVASEDADGNTAKRGTVQHVVMRGDRASAMMGPNDEIVLNVTATMNIEGSDAEVIPYAIAVTIEVAATARVQVYDEIAARIRPRVQVISR